MSHHRIVEWAALCAVAVLLAVLPAVSPAGRAAAAGPGAAMGDSPHQCRDCHICDEPTGAAPCLGPCPRQWPHAGEGGSLGPSDVPAEMRLDVMAEVYGPVLFNHRLHAEMAEMGVGCVACHHYTPTGASHPACRECHPAQRDDGAAMTARPGLKGAYHRQCMACHREWSQEDDCEVCHAPATLAAGTMEAPAAGGYRPCKEPERHVYETAHEGGRYVTFFHRNHSHYYGMVCSDCHREDPCVACHYQGRKPASVVRAEADAMHYKCAACHDIQAADNCALCHAESPRPHLDHGEVAGWPLAPYHGAVSCARCHGEGAEMAMPEPSCEGCHQDWDAESFDHAVVGLVLDENHRDFWCDDCHIERRFEEPPTCSDCHDEKQYPRDLPGERRAAPPAGGGAGQ